MAFFTYKARESGGGEVTGLVEAAEEGAAARLVRGKNLFVISLEKAKDRSPTATFAARFKRVSFGDIVNFTRQLATMIVAGLSIPESLAILRDQTTNPVFGRVLEDIEHHIVAGGNLADALAKYPKHFSSIFVALVRAGESSGTLDQVLQRLADTLESEREFRGKITGALIYPVIILIGMGVVIMIMMTVVVPRLTELYTDFGTTLPASTQLLVAISTFFVRFWWLILILVFGGSIFYSRWRKTPVGELVIDTVALRVPLLGELKKKVMLVEFTRTLSMLISSGIHILEGLRILKDSLGNVLFRNAVAGASQKVEKGYPLGESFSQFRVFPPILSQMMKVGEETGKLDDTLGKLSAYFQSESEHLVKGLTTAIEPIIMVFLGVGVGFIVISVITPIYNLTSQLK